MVHPAMTERCLRLDPAARITVEGTCLESDTHALSLGPGLDASVEAMRDWTTPAALFAQAATKGHAQVTALAQIMDQMKHASMLQHGLREGNAIRLSVHPRPGTGLRQDQAPAPLDEPLVFAPALTLTPCAAGWRMASPLAWGTAEVSTDVLPAIAAFRTPQRSDAAEAALLAEVGLLVRADDHPTPMLADHDLWSHTLSRRGTAPGRVGADPLSSSHARPTRRLADRTDLKLPMGETLDTRKSWRDCPVDALSAQDVSRLLQHALSASRTGLAYPSAGGRYEIDAYVALRSPPQFYRFDPAEGQLTLVGSSPETLLTDAGASMGRDTPPPGLITLVADFASMTDRYGDASYALILKNAGVLMQTIHLIATAMGIGSCILGGGNTRSFATLTRIDPLIQGPVGEIALTGTFTTADTGTKDS